MAFFATTPVCANELQYKQHTTMQYAPMRMPNPVGFETSNLLLRNMYVKGKTISIGVMYKNENTKRKGNHGFPLLPKQPACTQTQRGPTVKRRTEKIGRLLSL